MQEIPTNIKKPALVAKRREQILQAALDLFRNNGYHGTSMRKICEKSKVNRASIYDYFQSKADILIYIYNQMMSVEGNYNRTFSDVTISGWDDLEPFIRSTIHSSWTKLRHPIQLLYRETISLDGKSRQYVLKIESDYVEWVSKNLQKGLGLKAVTPDLKILANNIVFFNSFIPLRGWNMHDLDQESILDFVVDMLMMKLAALKPSTDGK